MVAKATQNLFDINISGAGFHFTSHLISLVALFIACFAIAGYVSFRDDSVPASALKEQSDSLTKRGETWTFEKEFDLSTLEQSGNTDIIAKTGLVLPADAVIVNSTLLVQVAGAGQTGTAETLLYRDSVGKAVGADLTGAKELTEVITVNELKTRGHIAGSSTVTDSGVGPLNASQEVYFGTKTSNFNVQGSTNPKVIATVVWTGSAPDAY